MCLCIYRLLACIPLPFIRPEVINGTAQSGTLALFNLMTGGSMFKMTIGALGVSPYITASIFIHLLGVMLPSLQNLQKSEYYYFVTDGIDVVAAISGRGRCVI